MTPYPMQLLHPILLLLSLIDLFGSIAQVDAVITDQAQLPIFQSGQCYYSQVSLGMQYNAYTTAININSVTFAPNVGWNITTLEICNPDVDVQKCASRYHMEALRQSAATCQTCPYHFDTYWKQFDPYNRPHQLDALFGPCFDGLPSVQTVCTQHPALAPRGFTGIYHYPKQMPLADEVWAQSQLSPTWPTPMHLYFSDAPSSEAFDPGPPPYARDPSYYGLGKKAVQGWLSTVTFKNKTTQAVNTLLTDAFKRPYTTINGVEQWLKWAQFFCTPACHRDGRYTVVVVRTSDVEGNPENAYLSSYISTATTVNEVPRCTPCTNGFASYDWNDALDAPFHPRLNMWAPQCYPWFGTLPSIVHDTYGYRLNSTVISHTNFMADGIVSPEEELVVSTLQCPINTYNRVCAHAKKYYYATNQMNKYQCTPCPPGGYHTAGLTGQWYCRPPPGNIFTFQPLLDSIQQVWANRDLLNVAAGFPELECGYLSSHCLQQPECGTPGMLPEAFNELYIFSKLLQSRACTSGFYCPDSFTEIACPQQRPWSPPNSFAQINCSCLAGTYLSADGLRCLPCTAQCTQSGFYLPLSQCVAKNGALKDAPCMPCTNIPPTNATSTGIGFEVLGAGGICPFACVSGAQLIQIQQGSYCTAQYLCQPLAHLPKDASQRYLYYSASSILPVDALTVALAEGYCTRRLGLTTALNSLTSDQWSVQPETCYQQCNDPRQLCYAPAVANGFPETPWYSLTAPLICASCPGLPLVPITASIQLYVALAQSTACSLAPIQCAPTGTYFNSTAWQCQSCAQRESMVCPNNTRLRGQGCLGSDTPFNVSSPAADCQHCTLNLPSMSGFYLNYNSHSGTAATGGCAIEPCLSLPSSLYYWAVPCGGDQAGVQRPCTLSECPAGQFQMARCTMLSDRICSNCTIYSPGYTQVDTCTALSDSQWRQCRAGFYCNGNGSEIACPLARTSQPGMQHLSDCYCKVGTVELGQSGQCVPKQCAGSVQDPNLPGPSLVSSEYMTLDPETMSSTLCVSCGGGAVTRDSGLELTSCACPIGQYAVLNTSTSIQCMPCSSRTAPVCQDSRALPTPCSRTFVPPKCQCALAPFSALLPTQDSKSNTLCAASCLSGFTTTAQPRPLQGLPSVTGSMLYITDQAWIPLVTASTSITAFATTGELDDSFLGTTPNYHAEYVFWAVEGTMSIFAQLLYQTFAAPLEWQVFASEYDMQGNTYSITDVAVSRWNSQLDQPAATSTSRNLPLFVGALVTTIYNNKQQQELHICITQFLQGSFSATNPTVNLTLYTGATPLSLVAFTHTSTALGSYIPQAGGFFYVAYNLGASCGGLLLVNPLTLTTTPVSTLCGPSVPPLQGLAVRLDLGTGYPTVFVLLSSGLYQLDTIQGLIPSRALIPSSGGGYLTSLSPNMLLLSASGRAPLVADTWEWTWVDIAGLPQGTAPSHPHLAATGISPLAAVLVVAHGSRLFTINTAQCNRGSYYDGVSCVQHSCTKVQQCDPTRELIDNACVCIAGYYESTGQCKPCPVGSYCFNAKLYACPGSALTTLTQQSTSINDCICATTGYYFSIAANDCLQCPSNSWCPDRWSAFPCPGGSLVSTTTKGSLFPVGCLCQQGFTGPGCVSCPDSAYCPASTSTVYNLALIYTNITSTLALPLLTPTLLTYFKTPGSLLSSISNAQDLQSILYLHDLPSTSHTPLPALMVMLQVPNAQFLGWGQALTLVLNEAGFNVGTLPTDGTPNQRAGIPNNAPTQCLTGKVPTSPIASSCICAPGYEANGQQCSPCAANNFKSAAGSATSCVPCPVGLVSLPAAASCLQPAAAASSISSSNGSNTTLLIGAVVGGVLGLLLLLFVFQSFFISSSSASG